MNFKNLKLKTRLILAFLVFGITPAVTVSWITVNNLKSTLIGETEKRLTFVREKTAIQLEGLFQTMSNQVKTMSSNRLVVEAMKDFSEHYDTYTTELVRIDVEQAKKSVKSFYKRQFGEQYKRLNGGVAPFNLTRIFENLDPTELTLQYKYISSNSNPLGSKDELQSADDGTDWSRSHERYHPTIRKFLQNFGYYDIFLVHPKTGKIVYSVFKELDFGTSLLDGPYANTNFADAFKMAQKASKEDFVFITDLKPYYPSYEAPAGFISSPIFDGDEKVGVLIFQIPVEKIDAITTAKRKWKETGFGDSGEAYIMGRDKKMRSISRFLVEDPAGYFGFGDALGLTKKELNYTKNKETTTLSQTVDSEGVRAALSGETGFSVFPDYRNVNVFSSFRRLNIPGLDWYIFAEIDESEALLLSKMQQLLILVIGISILIIFIGAWFIASRLSLSLTSVTEMLKDISKSTKKSGEELQKRADSTSASANQQASGVQQVVTALEEIKAMVQRTAESSKLSEDKSQESKKMAEDGQNAVVEIHQAMQEIKNSNDEIKKTSDESSEKISGINELIKNIATKTQVINDIVFQTKLLSFNASVEAARAGEHGKGFAVVAEEIGNLAQMSGTAASEINDMLEESIKTVNHVTDESRQAIEAIISKGAKKVESGVEISKSCRSLLSEVMKNVESVVNMMTEITNATREQSLGVQDMAESMNGIDRATSENARIAQKTSQNAKTLSEQANRLTDAVERLENEIHGYAHIEKTPHRENVISLQNKPKRTAIKKKVRSVSGSDVPANDESLWEEI